MGVTDYSGWSRFYFNHLLDRIIQVGRLTRPGLVILDFGCGKGVLKERLPGAKIIGYDILPELSDVKDWRKVDFDVLVSNEVFYSFREEDLEKLLRELKAKDPGLELVVGISRQGWLNNIGKHLLGGADAHSQTKIRPKRELEVLREHCRIIERRNVVFLADVLRLAFRRP